MLTGQERIELERRINSPTVAKRDSERAEIILLRAEGFGQQDVAERLGCSSVKVSRWTARFRNKGLDGLGDKAGRRRKQSLRPEQIEQVITQVNRPPDGYSRWSIRAMAKQVGISRSSVQRIRKANDLKPHRAEIF